ncbi:MAG: RNA-binding protein Hfq [Candidatus Ozemobacter sibiricus]|jgi:host factor-I protein|uniref:RNA-binding protein Hfq n=1 Tax=Candidatus Ozemobacter sibiricus TaxID=2268124 RepID=A0A367ZRX8_9BACT|nr:MAG: RNA-binding protein Hfq [Candidatus Ozemobacter sibiricus]
MPAINIQDTILQVLKGKAEPVKIFLMKGFQIQGTVLDFDTFVILLESEGKKQLIYKHAISTIQLPDDFSLKAATAAE